MPSRKQTYQDESFLVAKETEKNSDEFCVYLEVVFAKRPATKKYVSVKWWETNYVLLFFFGVGVGCPLSYET